MTPSGHHFQPLTKTDFVWLVNGCLINQKSVNMSPTSASTTTTTLIDHCQDTNIDDIIFIFCFFRFFLYCVYMIKTVIVIIVILENDNKNIRKKSNDHHSCLWLIRFQIDLKLELQ